MPVAIHISPHHMSTEIYERVMKELKESGAGNPGTGFGGGEVDVHPVHSELPSSGAG